MPIVSLPSRSTFHNLDPPTGLQLVTSPTIYPTSTESWLITALNVRVFASLRLQAVYVKPTAYKNLTQQIIWLEEQAANLNLVFLEPGKTEREQRVNVAEREGIFATTEAVRRELAEFGIAQAEGLIGPNIVSWAVRLYRSEELVALQHLEPTRIVSKYNTPVINEANTAIFNQYEERDEILIQFPNPILLRERQNIRLEVQVIGPKINIPVETTGVSTGGVLVEAALEQATITYTPETERARQ